MERPRNTARDLALLSFTCVAAAVVARALPPVGVPLAAFALVWTTLVWGSGVALAFCVVATAAAAVLQPSSAIFVLPAFVAAGPLGVRVARWRGPYAFILMLSAVVFAGSLAADVASFAAAGVPFAQGVRETVTVAADQVLAANPPTGTDDQIKAAKAALEAWKGFLIMTWPAGYMMIAIAAAYVAAIAGDRVAKRLGAEWRPMPQLKQVDLSVHIAWPVIGGLAALSVAALTHVSGGIAQAIGLNLLVVARLPLSLQGLGVFASLYDKLGVGKVGRAFGYVLLLLAEVFMFAVSLVGLADLWVNFRRLDRASAGGTPLERPGSSG